MSSVVCRSFAVVLFATTLLATVSCRNAQRTSRTTPAKLKTFDVTGVVQAINTDGTSLVIQHGEIPDFMPAMTMPFKVKTAADLAGLLPGDEISFRLLVTEDESWIDHINKTGTTALIAAPVPALTNPVSRAATSHPLLDFRFTNELGQPVSFNDFKGQAVAYTFFFTRCPIPEFCPRLSKNFAEATQKLLAQPGAPTNWHFLSFTFDPQFDTPAVLQTYGKLYHYNSNHWSFLTGPKDKLAELAAASDVKYEPAAALFNHNFRTLVIDAAGHLQMTFPVSGDLSDNLVAEILKAAAVTNR